MTTKRRSFEIISFLLSVILILQSCTVYKSKTSTLNEASKSNNRVKIETNDSQTLKFKNVTSLDGEYYGLAKKAPSNFIYEKVLIDKNNIRSIKLKNSNLSTILSIGIPVIAVGVLLIIGGSSMGGSMNFGDTLYW